MRLPRRVFVSLLGAGPAVALLGVPVAYADARRQALVNDCLVAVRKVVESSDFPDAPNMLKRARAVLIVPNLVQAGVIIGAAGGRGVLMVRGDGNWSYPAFYGMGSGSIGLQIGAKVAEVVIIIRTDKGLEAILDSRYKFGAEAALTVATIGGGAAGATTAAAGADIVAFSKATGLFAGAALEGSYLDPDNDWNQLYYGQGARTRSIVMERRFSNPGADPLRQYLAKF